MQCGLSPIARLPPEILSEIFVRCVPDHPVSASIDSEEMHNDPRLNIPRVCSLWHRIALNSSSFWSTLIPLHPTSVSTFITRAKVAPLVIRADLDEMDRVKLKSVLLDNVQRLGTLELHSQQTSLNSFLSDQDLIDAAAPRLQYLKIVNTTARDGDEGSWIPSDLFLELGDRMEAERPPEFSLHLEGCAFPWGSAWYSQITHLHLENLVPELRPTMEELLTILVGSPALQTLALIHCPPTTANGFSFELPHLSVLTIRVNSSAPTCVHLWRHLTIPPSTVVHISRHIEALENHISMAALISDFAPTSRTSYDTIRITHRNGFTYHLLDSARPWWSRGFQLIGESCKSPLSCCNATLALINKLDFSTVTILHLMGWKTATTWAVLGQHLHHVQTLHLHEANPADWLDFFLTQAMFVLGLTHWQYQQYELSSRGEDGGLTHAWGGLQCLALHEFNLGHDLRGTSPQPTRSEMLRALLWARREGGARITRLEIHDCRNVFSHDLQHFRLFADVEHDGKGLEITTGEEYESLRSYSVDVLSRMLERGDGCGTAEYLK